MTGLLQRIWAKLSGQPMSSIASCNGSRAPINAKAIDSERPTTNGEMLHMRQSNSYLDTVPALNSSDPDAATTLKEKSEYSPASSEGIELKHEPPNETTATRLSYRDVNGRLHEIKVIDKPLNDYEPTNLRSQFSRGSSTASLRYKDERWPISYFVR